MRVAENALGRVAHPETVRSLEDDLIVALVRSFANGNLRAAPERERTRTEAMRRVEDVVAIPRETLKLQDLCNAVGVTQARLQTYSRQVLGVNIARHVYLRRLKQVRR